MMTSVQNAVGGTREKNPAFALVSDSAPAYRLLLTAY